LGPLGLAVTAASVAIGGGVLLWKRFNEQTRQQGIDLGKSLNDTTSAIDEVGTAFGKTSYVQEQAAKQQGVTTEQLTTAEQFIQSEAGKKMLKDYADTSMRVSQTVAGTSMASKLASYVISGVMGTSDVKSYLAALKAESPAQGAQIERYTKGLMGAKLDKMPGTLATDVYKAQSSNTATTLELMKRQQAQIQQTSTVDMVKNSSLLTKGITALTTMLNPASIPGTVAGMVAQRQVAVRGSMNRVGGMMASATNTQIESGLQNRLALEAQLNALLDERETLQKAANKDALAKDDAERLDYLNKVIPDVKTGITELGTALQSTSQGMDKMFSEAGTDQKNAVLDSLNTMIQESKNATAIFMADMARNDEKLSQDQKFGILSRLQNGALNPEGMQNMMTYARTGMQGISNAVQALPVGKLQSFSLEIGKMTGPQAQGALTNFGKRFVNAARAANLSGREAANAAKALGANKDQAKQVRIKVKMDKVDDITKGVNKKVSVSANTDAAKKKIDDLRKAAEKATGKKIKINASDNAGAVIKRLRNLIKSAEEADSQDPNINTSTNADETEGKVQSLSDTIMNVANVGPVDLNANDNATPKAEDAFAALLSVENLNPTPTITVTSNATSVANSTTAALANIPDEEVVVRVRKEGAGATGGLFYYASGGVHRGPGKVTGPGGPTADKVNARLSDGEFVIKASSVNKYGTGFLNAVNQGAVKKDQVPGYKDGSPIKASGMNEDQRKEYKKIIDESRGIVKEFKSFGKILEHARDALGKGMKGMDQEFAQYIIDNYNPKQIKKMFAGKKDVGAKAIADKFAGETYVQEVRTQQTNIRNAALRNKLLKKTGSFGNEGPQATAIGNMSDEQLSMYRGLKGKKKKNFLGRLVQTEKISGEQDKFRELRDKYKEEQDRKKEVRKNYKSAIGTTAIEVAGNRGMSISDLNKYADALGVSIDDLAQQIEDGDIPGNLAALGEAAIKSKEALEMLAMTELDKQSQRLSNNQSRMSNLQDYAAATGRQRVKEKFGKSQSELEANAAVADAQNAIDQGTIDDLNEKYDKQLNIIDQISQHQQAIANLERGRLTVAGALSSGDIAAAAAAAQEHRSSMAAFAQDQMRSQLENQQKAITSQLQDQINARTKEQRDIQNQIALITALANQEQAASIGNIQAENDALMTTGGYIAAANGELERQNGLLSQTVEQLTQIISLQAQVGVNVPENAPPVANPTTGIGGIGKGMLKPPKIPKHKKKKAFGGWVPGVGNYDKIPVMATPGEFIVRKGAAAKFGPTLRDINAGSFKGGEVGGGNVNIDNIIFQINGGQLNEREIADIAVRRMQTLDAATIRGGRF
jgi:hypothetical protein